jgi:hypothetical protein
VPQDKTGTTCNNSYTTENKNKNQQTNPSSWRTKPCHGEQMRSLTAPEPSWKRRTAARTDDQRPVPGPAQKTEDGQRNRGQNKKLTDGLKQEPEEQADRRCQNASGRMKFLPCTWAAIKIGGKTLSYGNPKQVTRETRTPVAANESEKCNARWPATVKFTNKKSSAVSPGPDFPP